MNASETANSCRLTIDGRAVEVAPGQTLLEAARKLGIDIPTLCHLEKCTPATSCLVCLVKLNVNGQSKLVPSCATKALPGMIVESETDEVHETRRTALELLLSDHVGDCLSPCHRICPLQMNIPAMIRQIEGGRLEDAAATVRSALPLAAVLGRLCHHPCENGCRRGTWDQPAAIRDMERFVADHDLKSSQPWVQPVKRSSGKSVVIVGGGPTGLAAAYFLALNGHACTVLDRHDACGGSLRTQVDEKTLPRDLLEAELARLNQLGVQFKGGITLGREVTLDGLLGSHNAVLMACGRIGKEEARDLGIDMTTSGIKADAQTGQTSRPGVFAAGNVVKPIKQLVRALSDGKAAAELIDQFLNDQPVRRRDKPFSSIMGRLEDGELPLFLRGANPAGRTAPSCGECAGFTSSEASGEAARCLHCDCRAAGNCKLQHYAECYHADAGRFRQQRRRFEQQRQPGHILFEPGKCILCGICVQLAEQAREPLGLAFIGRGFEVRVAAPFNRTMAEGLQKVAVECVEHCPTGALVFDDQQRVP